MNHGERFKDITASMDRAINRTTMLSNLKKLATPGSQLTHTGNGYDICVSMLGTVYPVKNQEQNGGVRLARGGEKLLAAIQEFFDAQLAENAETKKELKTKLHKLLGDL